MTTNEISGKPSIAESFSPGQVLAGSLTLKEKLPTGDTGIPWLAHDGDSGRDVALLFLPGILLEDSRVMDELRAQVKLNRQLIHPHVLRTHDFIEEEGWAAISSDAVEAEPLASLLAKRKNGCFDASEITAWITTLCQTLDDAHRASLLHRDLVPQNILLTKDGEILIANFGISRIILDALARAQGPGKIDEHLASMSPQQLDGELPARWDDIYALGIVIYQLLTGKPPFHTGDILPQIRKNIPPSISARRAELGITGEPVPANWEKVVAACLEKHTTQRPKSAREVGVKLGTEISLVQPAPALVRAETREPAAAKAPQETGEAKKIQKPAGHAAAKEPGESKEALIEDIVWRKPGQRPQPAPGEPASFKHLLEKLPEEKGAEKKSPGFKIALAVALLAGAVVVIILSHGRTGEKPATAVSAPPVPAVTPAAVPTPMPSPQITNVEPARTPVVLPPGVPPEKLRALEQARKAFEDLQKGVQEKANAQQQAESDAAAAKSALDAQNAALEDMKKVDGETANLSKQRQDEETKAAADAASAAADAKKAADDAEAAKKAADEKTRIAADAAKAKQQVLDRMTQQGEDWQKAYAGMQALQKAAEDKRDMADALAKDERDAEARLQVQQVLLKQAEADASQQNAAPAPQPSPGAVLSLPSGTGALVPMTPDNTPSANSIEAQEKKMVDLALEKQNTANVTPEPSATPSAPVTYVPNPKSQIDQTLTNSLGMKFQPVGDVLFCIWLTRVQDFEVFARETHYKGNSWLQPGFKQGPDHPVVFVTWNDAIAFCKWLTDKERKSGLLAPNQSYRLPTDLEWSKAVGLPEETGRTPYDRDVGIKDVYPWGKQWPPPPGAGNYDGEETATVDSIKGYDDGYVFTSPVGSFAMNKYGLYDMGGNAWEWCMDWYDGAQKQKTLRGASWYNGDLQLSLLSSCRWPSAPDISTDNFGFRCVIATEGRPKK